MITKTENCLYCGSKMESKTAKKKFCSDLHRVYWNREKNALADKKIVLNDLNKNTNVIKTLTKEEAKSNFTINTTQKIDISDMEKLFQQTLLEIKNK